MNPAASPYAPSPQGGYPQPATAYPMQPQGYPVTHPGAQMAYPAAPYPYAPPMPMNIVVQNTQTVGGGGLVRVANRNKFVACVLAFFLGGLGVHKFYLGQIGMGILYLLASFTLIPAFIAVIETLILLVMSEREFDMRYNVGLGR